MTETKHVYPVGNYSIFLLQDSDPSPNLACAVLLILLVLNLILNSFVLLSILWSPLRSCPHNASFAIIMGVSLMDGVFNLTSSIVFHASWSELPHFYGKDAVMVWCRCNAAALQITGMALTLTLAVLSYDRLSTIKGDLPRKKTLKWALVLSIFGSSILACPVAFGVLTTTLFEQRMSCNPAYASRQPKSILIAITIVGTYSSAWLFIVRNSYMTMKKILNKRRRLIGLELVARQRAAERGSPPRAMTSFNSALWCQIWGTGNDMHVYILTGLLITVFMLTVMPNIIAVQVRQFYNVYDIPEAFYVMNQTLSVLNPIRTDIFDSIFAWTRHGYNVFSPGLILLMHNEIRKQCRIIFCCCFIGGNTYIRKQSRTVSAFVREKKWQKKSKTVADYRTPVLFSTSQGLHLRTIREDQLEQEEPQFVIKFCDVTLEDGRMVTRKQTPVRVEPKLNETFVIESEVQSLGKTFVKSSKGLDISKSSRNRAVIDLGLIAENSGSLFSVSQGMRDEDS